MKPQKRQIVLELQSERPPVSLFCDSFAIHDAGAFVEMDFLNSRSGVGVSVRVQKLVLDQQKQGFTKYLSDLGMPETEVPKAKLFAPSESLFADVIGVARQGEVAEISFHAVCWKVIIDKSKAEMKKSPKSGEPILMPAFCVALIRSNIDLQRHWIGSLYPATE